MAGTLAIDLGSTTTVVAFQAAGAEAVLLPLPPLSLQEPTVIPSLIWWSGQEASRPLIGRQVIEAGLVERGGEALQRDFKRWIGRSDAGTTASDPPTPEQCGELLLEQIWQRLPVDLKPERLVLTAPIDSYLGYRQWLLKATAALTVPEVALVDEPTAAAIGAGLPAGSRVLVIDLGGGTTDLALVHLQGGEGRAAPIAQLLRFGGRDLSQSGQALRTATVLGKAGLAIGGRDIDRWIAAALAPQLMGADPLDPGLLAACEQLKCRLSDQEEALSLWFPQPEAPAQALKLNRGQLEALLDEQGLPQVLDQLLQQVLAAARAAGVERDQIDAVLPVGGSSRIPFIRHWLAQQLPGVPLRGERPVEAVALGALRLTPGVAVKDLLSRGVSLRCWDQRSREHRWHPLFVAGQTWPNEQPLLLRLACSEPDQQQLELQLGEPIPEQRSEVVYVDGIPVLRRQSAGAANVAPWPEPTFSLPLSPAGQPGSDRVELRFWINSEGQLELEASDLLRQEPLGHHVLGPVR